MTETSGLWDGTDTGDAVGAAPYDLKTDLAKVLISLSEAANNSHKSFVTNEDNRLEVSSGVNKVTVATGKALVYGTRYESDEIVEHTIATPAGATRIDTIVLRKEWNGQIIRQQRVAGTEGAGAPALTQTEGDTWETPLADVTITTGGVITIKDRRPLAPFEGRLVKGADESRSSVSLVADSQLVVALEGGVAYKFRFILVYAETVAGTDLSVNVTGTGFVSAWCYGFDGTDTIAFKSMAAVDDWGAAIGSDRALLVEGIVVPTADSNLQLLWGAANNTGGNIALKANSSLLLVRG